MVGMLHSSENLTHSPSPSACFPCLCSPCPCFYSFVVMNRICVCLSSLLQFFLPVCPSVCPLSPHPPTPSSVSLYSPGWSGTHRNTPVSDFPGVGMKGVCHYTAHLYFILFQIFRASLISLNFISQFHSIFIWLQIILLEQNMFK